jgi:hypothetical protein
VAYPFRPLRRRKLRKRSKEFEDSAPPHAILNRPFELETPFADPSRKTRPLPAFSVNIATDKIISQP